MGEKFEMPADLLIDWKDAGLLGHGGQGIVHKVMHSDGVGVAAVKMLGRVEAYDQERFRREIETLSGIDHPNVVPVLKHGTSPRPYYMMPLGVPLDKHWSEIRKMVPSSDLFVRSYEIIRAVLSGMEAVHAQNLVHRDLKPGNVLMITNRPAVADFGIVHIPDAERITKRPAGNQFARYIPALYDLTEAPKSWDCFSVVAIWAWMLADDPRLSYGNYHWRFHRFIADPRCEIVRAIMAACSAPDGCPEDAGKMIQLVDTHYHLAQIALPSPQPTGPAVAAMAMALADQETLERERSELVQIAAFGAATQLAPLIRTLISCATNLAQGGLPAEYEGVHADSVDEIAKKLVRDALRSQKMAGVSGVRFARVQCGGFSLNSPMDSGSRNLATFEVCLSILWHDSPHEDHSLFSLLVDFKHARLPQLSDMRSRYYSVGLDGLLDGLDVEAKCKQVSRFLTDPALWMPREGPPLDPPPDAWADEV
jgi:hypothetical protein